jgi:hypothetical protein
MDGTVCAGAGNLSGMRPIGAADLSASANCFPPLRSATASFAKYAKEVQEFSSNPKSSNLRFSLGASL